MMRKFGIFISAILLATSFGVANAATYSISIETIPQVVDLFGNATVRIKLTKGTTPVSATQVFLGLQNISGSLKSEMLVTDKNGQAETLFFPKEVGEGFIAAKATIINSGVIETVEAVAAITVRDLNYPPESFVDQIYPLPGRVGQPMTFKGHGTDEDGRVTRCGWSMGDGKNYDTGGDKSEITHTYNYPGIYEVGFTATDDRNNTSKPVISRVTVVDNRLPVVAIDGNWPEKAYIGIEALFPVTVTDAESELQSLMIDYGDMTTEKIEIYGGEFRHTFNHMYTKPGIFNVSVTPNDKYGEGESFPKPSWPVKVEGEALGGLVLKISGAEGKTVRLVGPHPSMQTAYEVTIGAETVATGQILAVGKYRLLASDLSFGFEGADDFVEVKPFENTLIETSIWIPSISMEPAVKSGTGMVGLKITDQYGSEISKKTTFNASVDNGSIEDQADFQNGRGYIWIKPKELTVNVNVSARIGFVECRSTKLMMFPMPLAKIKLTPQTQEGQTSVVVTSPGMITGQLELTWTLFDRIERKSVPTSLLFVDLPRRIYVSSATFKIPVRPAQSIPDRYTLSVACEIQITGVRISDTCSFDPCAGKNKLEAGWGMLPAGKTGIDLTIKDQLGRPMGGQIVRISYEFGRAIGWIPPTATFESFPKVVITDPTGYAWTSFDLKTFLEGIDIEDVKATFTTVCSGITYVKTVSIPPPKESPAIIAQVTEKGTGFTVSLKALDATGEIAAGCWLDIRISCCDPAQLAQLGYPPSSIRTSHTGNAHFDIRQPSNPITLTVRATISGLPAMCIVELPKR